jgi:hypothetical protein
MSNADIFATGDRKPPPDYIRDDRIFNDLMDTSGTGVYFPPPQTQQPMTTQQNAAMAFQDMLRTIQQPTYSPQTQQAIKYAQEPVMPQQQTFTQSILPQLIMALGQAVIPGIVGAAAGGSQASMTGAMEGFNSAVPAAQRQFNLNNQVFRQQAQGAADTINQARAKTAQNLMAADKEQRAKDLTSSQYSYEYWKDQQSAEARAAAEQKKLDWEAAKLDKTLASRQLVAEKQAAPRHAEVARKRQLDKDKRELNNFLTGRPSNLEKEYKDKVQSLDDIPSVTGFLVSENGAEVPVKNKRGAAERIMRLNPGLVMKKWFETNTTKPTQNDLDTTKKQLLDEWEGSGAFTTTKEIGQQAEAARDTAAANKIEKGPKEKNPKAVILRKHADLFKNISSGMVNKNGAEIPLARTIQKVVNMADGYNPDLFKIAVKDLGYAQTDEELKDLLYVYENKDSYYKQLPNLPPEAVPQQ